MIRHEQVTLTLSGTSGNTNTTNPVVGRVLAIHLDFGTGMAATADTTISTPGNGVPALTILAITDSATDAWYYPRHQVHGSTGTALTLEGTEPLVEAVPVADHINIAVAQGTDTKTLTVTILYEQ